jgi:hypothetical protein
VLRNLWAASSASTHLIVIETVVRHACPDNCENLVFPGAMDVGQAQKPLLANYGQARETPYIMDMSVSTE